MEGIYFPVTFDRKKFSEIIPINVKRKEFQKKKLIVATCETVIRVLLIIKAFA